MLSKTPEQSDGFARIELARVTDVNMREYSVDLLTTFTHKPLVEVPFASPYTKGDPPAGVNIMPEIGSYCYVVTCADGTNFIVGFIVNPTSEMPGLQDGLAVTEEPSLEGGVNFAGYRPPLEPGDIHMSTKDRNFLVLRRGGLLELGSTHLAKRVYIPIQNTVRDYFQRYEAFSPLGEIEWGHPTLKVGEQVTGDTDNTPVLIKYSFKNKAQEDITGGRYTLEIRMGDVSKNTLDLENDNEHIFGNKDFREKPMDAADGDPEGVLSFVIYSHDSKKATYTFQLDKEGNNFLKTRGNVHIECDEDLYLRVKKNTKVEFGAGEETIELTEAGKLEAMVKQYVVKAVKEMLVSSPAMKFDNRLGTFSIENSALVNIQAAQIVLGGTGVAGGGGGGGPAFPIVKDNGLLANLSTHTHLVNLALPQPICAAIVANATPGSPGVIVPGITATSPQLASATAAAAKGTKAK